MNKTTIELEPSNGDLAELWDLSRSGVAFYNAALGARIETREAGGQESRVAQAASLPSLCERAGIELGALPKSVMTNLLSALDAAIFGAKSWRPRDRQRFWPLCWSTQDIRSSWSRLTLVALPSLRLPLPWKYAGQGRATRVTVAQDWKSGQFSAQVEWRLAIPPASFGAKDYLARLTIRDLYTVLP